MLETLPEDRFDETVRTEYLRTCEDDAASAARAFERVRREGSRPRNMLAALLEPRPVLVSPALAAVVVVAVLATGLLAGSRLVHRPGASAPASPAISDATRMAAGVAVQFVLQAPGASRVTIAGDFNGWDAEATPMARAGSGDTWTAQVTVPRGLHLYSFVLDGSEWRPDPSAPLAADQGFGSRNSVLVVSEGPKL